MARNVNGSGVARLFALVLVLRGQGRSSLDTSVEAHYLFMVLDGSAVVQNGCGSATKNGRARRGYVSSRFIDGGAGQIAAG